MRKSSTRRLARFAVAIGPVGLATVAFAATLAPDVPKLWRVEVVGEAAASAKPVFVCADRSVREAFSRALPEVDGQTCNRLERPITGEGQFLVRCGTGAVTMVASSVVRGDPERDFTVNTRISARPADTTQGEPRHEFEQTRRYRLAGACPAGWAIGDTAGAGDRSVVNALSGVTRTLGSPFAPPAP
jgi:hypothetical protein